jgi:uncharacterized ubiquitin-like protein YukD
MTSAPFVTTLRTGKKTIDLSRGGGTAITIRAEMAEVWDTVRISVSPTERVATVKKAALDAMAPEGSMPEEFMVKLRGWEILDESATLADAGVTDGSILLVTYRRRRAVK